MAWKVEVIGVGQVASDTCLGVPPNTLPGVKLPKRLILTGPNGDAVLVGWKRWEAGPEVTVVRISPTLRDQIAPQLEDSPTVSATINRAGLFDLWGYIPKKEMRKIRVAAMAAILAICGAAAELITRTEPLWIVVVVLAITATVAIWTAWAKIEEAITPT